MKEKLMGTGQVYRFSIRQLLKGKANLVFLALLVLLSLLSVPAMALLGGAGILTGEGTAISALYIYNTTDCPLDFSEDERYSAIPATVYEEAMPDDIASRLGENEAAIGVTKPLLSGYQIEIVASSIEGLEMAEQEQLANAARTAVDRTRLEAMGVNEKVLAQLQTGYEVNVESRESYLHPEKNDFEARFSVQYLYAILVMMMSCFTISYIVRIVIEERASRLVETLLVSVRPLALLAGKILAVMTYIVLLFGIMTVGIAVSWNVSGQFFDLSAISGLIGQMGLGTALSNLDAGAVLALLVSIVLAYLTFSVLSGLFGVSCSSMDDVEWANTQVILIVMAGYMLSMFGAGFGDIVNRVFALIPFVSVFAAPAQYLTGDIGFGLLAVSWLLQGAVVVLLFWFTARVYNSMILYRGSRVKLSGLLAAAKRHG